MPDTPYTEGFKAGLAWHEDSMLRLAFKHIVQLWGKPDATPDNVMAGMLHELYPEMTSLEKRNYIMDMRKDEEA